MAPFHNYTTKAKEAIHRAHQLAVERGHNQVSTAHLLAALLMQEESMVLPMLEQLEIDIAHFTDSVLELIEGGSGNTAVSPSFQLYLTPELVRVFEAAPRISASFNDQFVSPEHLLLGLIEHPGPASDVLTRFRIDRAALARVLSDIKEGKIRDVDEPKKLDRASLTNLKDKINQMVKEAESSGGLDIEKIIMELKEPPEIINQEIKRLLEDGTIYEPRPGKLRYLG